MNRVARMSRIYLPGTSPGPIKPKSRSAQLLSECGFIYTCGDGLHALLPLALRVVHKIEKIIREEMESIGAMEICLPALAEKRLWESCGRWNASGPELIKLQDRHQYDYCLQPTHEESVTNLVASAGWGCDKLPLTNFPLRLYQITEKYRDEARPASGLLRSRVFRMKDLYTFDCNEESSMNTYKEVLEAYNRIFKHRMNLTEVFSVEADAGIMGGSLSHEFQLANPVGQDRVTNEVGEEVRTTEVGHCFNLGTKYSTALHAHINGVPAQMCCFGIGVTRLLPAIIDSCNPTDGLRWPVNLAPYQVCLIPPKEGSKTDHLSNVVWDLATNLNMQNYLNGEVIVDDRDQTTVGKRLYLAKRLGFPCILLGGKQLAQDPPLLEMYTYGADSQYHMSMMTSDQIISVLRTHNNSNCDGNVVHANFNSAEQIQ